MFMTFPPLPQRYFLLNNPPAYLSTVVRGLLLHVEFLISELSAKRSKLEMPYYCSLRIFSKEKKKRRRRKGNRLELNHNISLVLARMPCVNCPCNNLNFYDIFTVSRRSLLSFGKSVKAEM